MTEFESSLPQRACRAGLRELTSLLLRFRRQRVLVLVEVLDLHVVGEGTGVAVAIGLQLADRHRLVGGVLDLVLEAGIIGALQQRCLVGRGQRCCLRGGAGSENEDGDELVTHSHSSVISGHSMSMVTADSFHRPSDGMKPSWYFTCFGVVSKRPFRRSTPFSSIFASPSGTIGLATMASNTARLSIRSLNTARSFSGGNCSRNGFEILACRTVKLS